MSPDHGTASDSAGKNIAHFESTKQAILSAIEFAVNRA
jgi:4-hydroxy-L-threonine phosphate dehydrogenase PdxA